MSPPAVSLARAAAALDYLERLDTIEGWLLPDTALAMIETLWLQERAGIAGDVAEIGVFRGKSFLALAAGARPGERLIAIDLFDAGDPAAERPEQDVAPYGTGNRAAFLANLARFFPGTRPEVIEGSSLALRGQEAAAGLAGLRMLSIDGGHTRAMTLNDLAIADVALGAEGVCWLDDVLNAHWTGVISGLFAFLETAPGLTPVALFPNKLVLCRPGAASFYRAGFRALFPRALERERIELHAAEIDVYGARWPEVSASLRIPHRPLIAAGEAAEAARHAAEARADAAEALAAAADLRARDAAAAVAAYTASTSWRITAPLRALTRVLAPRRG
jgi:Methyltransferase domain